MDALGEAKSNNQPLSGMFPQAANDPGEMAAEGRKGRDMPYIIEVVMHMSKQVMDKIKYFLGEIVGPSAVVCKVPSDSLFCYFKFNNREDMIRGMEYFLSRPMGLDWYPLARVKVNGKLVLIEDVNKPECFKKLEGLITAGSYYLDGAPVTRKECQRQVELKCEAARREISALNHALEKVLSSIVRDRTKGLVFRLEDMRCRVPAGCLSDFYIVENRAGKELVGSVRFGDNLPSHNKRSPRFLSVENAVLQFVEMSGVPIVDATNQDQFWQSLFIYCNHAGAVIIRIDVCVTAVEKVSAGYQALKKSLLEYFLNFQRALDIVGLHFHEIVMNGTSNTEVWIGDTNLTLVESVGDLRWYVGPKDEFFAKPPGMDLLCKTVAELLGLTSGQKEDVVVVMGCQIGTIGIYLSRLCQKVILYCTEPADNVRANLALNSVANCTLITSDKWGSKELYKSLTEQLEPHNSVSCVCLDVAIKCTSREQTIRRMLKVEKLVYAAVRRKQYVPFAKMLFHSDTTCMDSPFIPVKLVPLDLTPHVFNTHYVLLCERENRIMDKLERNPKYTASAQIPFGQGKHKPPTVRIPNLSIPHQNKEPLPLPAAPPINVNPSNRTSLFGFDPVRPFVAGAVQFPANTSLPPQTRPFEGPKTVASNTGTSRSVGDRRGNKYQRTLANRRKIRNKRKKINESDYKAPR